ncbi:ABC transporter permease [Oharaeibacter diazotrophicus]|uniref:Nucleoside ABC transporter membrane protein n=1 Tax=Oharaeibacter diazotrophicus TaxID=1920512 RepID=A0A4R6RDK7_9HYPH|nr:ABC transporter permease [Oharaeibacter diazotrophicus]TDP84155.1 nucleoside ABC transporter membrane protein [Oharaeibacter diazotrophicus]BBE73192.1 branched-chain amino acid transport system /permease component [Pleomorphomonas sp. SM30]GLS74982.1 ABC transporter permease [Oharaeibacter diazotrophicus]
MDFVEIAVNVLASTVRLTIPLLFTALAGLYSERAGIFDIGLEGKMLASAFAAASLAFVTGSPWLGLLGGVAVSVALSAVHGFASITNKGNQIVSGVAINFVASGLTAVLGQAWFSQGGRTPQLANAARFDPIVLPGAEALRGVPVLGPIYAGLISGHNILTYLAFLAVPFSWWVLYRTRFGLRLRAVGENPAAVDTAGISVVWLRYRAVICAGIFCGFAGTYLSIAQSAAFIKEMSAGKGYIALAALIFAKWRPVPVMFACLLFGFLDAVAIRLQGTPVPFVGEVPVQIFQALPYVLTVILLAGFIGTARPPKAGGVPYTKER